MQIALTKDVSTRSRPKAADTWTDLTGYEVAVSTRSRPKAADCLVSRWQVSQSGFNTQPPEGG